MIPYPDISPEIIRIGPVAIRWYGIMYLIGIALSYLLVKYQIKKRRQKTKVKKQTADSRLFSLDIASLYQYLILGLLIGARLGYVIFYNLSYYLANPLEIFAIWLGGMSFHGGLIGSVIAGILFCRKMKINAWQVADLVIVTAPLGVAFGRIGNFINAELYGRVTNVPWAMIFPDGGPLPRHPSQLYQFFLEGIALFIILWILKDKGFRPGIISALFVILYGVFRFFVEFFREPDPHLGFIVSFLTMGQILSGVMILLGLGIVYYLKTRHIPGKVKE
jgi:phosphatidylglycerol:prolipoprotein diacylglycerol transferase